MQDAVNHNGYEPQMEPKPVRRKRRRLKTVPPMPVSVKALWDSVTEGERRQAHRRCAMILETWVGRTSRAAAAQSLGVEPIQLWQLSQRALGGMLAGLVTQPRTRRRVTMMDPEDDPKALRKRIAELEAELSVASDLIALLRELPAHREAEASGQGVSAKATKKAKRTKKAGKSVKGRPTTVMKRAASEGSTDAMSPRSEDRGAGGKKADDARDGDAPGSGPVAG